MLFATIKFANVLLLVGYVLVGLSRRIILLIYSLRSCRLMLEIRWFLACSSDGLGGRRLKINCFVILAGAMGHCKSSLFALILGFRVGNCFRDGFRDGDGFVIGDFIFADLMVGASTAP